MADIRFNNRDPIYLQVIDHFRKQIVSDQLSLDAELPSRREIARQLGINPNTVQRAFSEMEEMGWIYTEPNRPSNVTKNPEIVADIKRQFVEQAVKEFVSSIQTIDITYEEVTDLLFQEIEKQTKNKGVEKHD